jgi:pimeloyl-ACP methyl ester carboxylesterase
MVRTRQPDQQLLPYRRAGRGQPVLLLHGWAANGRFFDQQLQALSENFDVIAPDLRGHGDAADWPGPMTLEQLAQDVSALLRALQLRDILAVGWSMGAMLVWRLPADLVSGQIIVDMAPKVLSNADWPHGLRTQTDTDVLTAAMLEDWSGFAQRVAHRLLAPHAPPALMRWCAEQFGRARPDAMAALWRDMVAEDARARVAALRWPSWVIHGQHSALYGAPTAQALAALLSGAPIIRFEQSGHAPHLEEPERFNHLVTAAAREIQHQQPITVR